MKDDTLPRPPTHQTVPAKPMALRFDWQDWLPYLEKSDVPDDQKRDFIEALWAIVLGFVDLGFDLNPTADICGEPLDLKAVLEAAVVHSENPAIEEKGDAA